MLLKKEKKIEEVIIFTDGGCDNNGDRVGGYGVVMQYKGRELELYGGERDTTNNRMEMLAVIKALEAIKTTHIPLKIHSDSAYVVNCFLQKWYVGWRKNNWKNSKKQPVENRDLWERMIKLYESQESVEFVKVKGHSGIELNERCDQLATKAMKEIREENRNG